MNHTRLELDGGLCLDARRAIWLPESRTLAIADPHLGYAWANRHAGQLLPIAVAEDTLPRLIALLEDYAPRELLILGDIVHRAAPVAALVDTLRDLVTQVRGRTLLRALRGNHDRHLARLLADAGIDLPLLGSHAAPPHQFLHGDAVDELAAPAELALVGKAGGRIIMGHEHPAISLSDGIASHLRAPCFLVGPQLVIVPAFSPWAAGANIRGGEFLSAHARAATFQRVIAVVAGKLLPVPLPQRLRDQVRA